MSLSLIVVIGIGAFVALSIPGIILTWRVFKRVFGVFDGVQKEIQKMGTAVKSDPFETLEDRVKRMTGPTKNPFV